MFFHLTGIKDISEKNYTLERLLQTDDISSVKSFLAKQKVIVLWLVEYTWEASAFWDFYAQLQTENGTITIVSVAETLEGFISDLIRLEFTVLFANSLSQPLEEAQVQQFIQQENQKYQELLQQQKAEAQAKKTWGFYDKKLKKAYDAIEQVIDQIDQLSAIGGKNILPATQKKLDTMKEEISKLRLATNYDKIIEELHKTMNFVVETQDFLLEQLGNDKIFTLASWSTITNVEVIREQTRLAKANLLSALGAQLSRDETLYVSLGKARLWSQYVYQDLQMVMSDKFSFLKQVMSGLELVFMFLILETSLLALFAQPLKIDFPLPRFGVVFVYLSVWACLMYFFNHSLQFKTLTHYLYVFCLFVVLYMLVIYGIKLVLVF